MMKLVLLDAGPLGLVSNPKESAETQACRQWIRDLQSQNIQVVVPEIADYEVRRELLRAQKTAGLARLNIVKATLNYAAITTEVMLKAAEFWAPARQMGKPTAPDLSLDGDVILAAQAALLTEESYEVVIATTNPSHLALFVLAERWQNIS